MTTAKDLVYSMLEERPVLRLLFEDGDVFDRPIGEASHPWDTMPSFPMAGLWAVALTVEGKGRQLDDPDIDPFPVRVVHAITVDGEHHIVITPTGRIEDSEPTPGFVGDWMRGLLGLDPIPMPTQGATP